MRHFRSRFRSNRATGVYLEATKHVKKLTKDVDHRFWSTTFQVSIDFIKFSRILNSYRIRSPVIYRSSIPVIYRIHSPVVYCLSTPVVHQSITCRWIQGEAVLIWSDDSSLILVPQLIGTSGQRWVQIGHDNLCPWSTFSGLHFNHLAIHLTDDGETFGGSAWNTSNSATW